MKDRLKILVVGGYGTFGGRLVELLENEPRLTLVVAGRSLQKAEAWCKARGTTKAQLAPAAFNREDSPETQLSSIKPDIVVDASGPFQNYGEKPYRLAEACIAQRIHYLDLADGTEFVDGIGKLDKAAREAGVFLLSGVSSFPVLTVAVVKSLSAEMTKINSIRGGIAPSPHAGVGGNVIRAIAGYAGQKISVMRDGREQPAYPLTETLRYTVATPGKLPLENRLFSLVDVPDLRLLARTWPDTKTIWMGAAPVPEVLHRALIGFAWLVRLRVLRSLSFMAPLMEFVTTHVRWGADRGGMFVEVKGENEKGVPVIRTWHLLAEGHDGPLIPSMAVEAIVRRIMAGTQFAPGARSALDDVTLADYDTLFASRKIVTGARGEMPDTAPLYRRILGSAWEDLPLQVRAMHDVEGSAAAEGVAEIRRGNNPLAQLAAAIMGFPKAGRDIPVTVAFDVKVGVETWTRSFAGERFSSRQYAGNGRSERLLVERFGPLTFGLALVLENDRLALVMRRWSFLGIPLPLWLCVRSDSYETVENGKFIFNVQISHPLTGLIVHYRGWLLRKS